MPKRTQEQPWGAETGAGSRRAAGKTLWPNWPRKALGVYARSSACLADVFRVSETPSQLHTCARTGTPVGRASGPAGPRRWFFLL